MILHGNARFQKNAEFPPPILTLPILHAADRALPNKPNQPPTQSANHDSHSSTPPTPRAAAPPHPSTSAPPATHRRGVANPSRNVSGRPSSSRSRSCTSKYRNCCKKFALAALLGGKYICRPNSSTGRRHDPSDP